VPGMAFSFDLIARRCNARKRPMARRKRSNWRLGKQILKREDQAAAFTPLITPVRERLRKMFPPCLSPN
ncbi:MAG TPA: hypothetical protein VEM35_07745, partial [Rhizomicrobium sp.]|nr:hypothetical protein [Rhizomicrobium sp.]